MSKLCILCAYRGREDRIEDFVSHYSKFYNDAEIILLKQEDSEKFKKGQLFNVGFLMSNSDVFVFVDIDIRLQQKIDFIKEMQIRGKPFYGYTKIEHCQLIANNYYKKINSRKPWSGNPGGLYVMTRQQYEIVNGHSNLYLGYGYEDNEMYERVGFERLSNTVLHIDHAPPPNRKKDQNVNEIIFRSRKDRDINLDGFKQTSYRIVFVDNRINVTFVGVTDISVCKDFYYKNLMISNGVQI